MILLKDMFNVNNKNNGTPSQNAWDQMELFNQLTLCNILSGRNDTGTPELRAAVASKSEEQKDDALVFWNVIRKSCLGCLMAVVSKPLQIAAHCWTTFLQVCWLFYAFVKTESNSCVSVFFLLFQFYFFYDQNEFYFLVLVFS